MDDAAVLVGGWQHKSVLTLDLYSCFDFDHPLVLEKGSKHYDSCDHLLLLYSNHDYVQMDDVVNQNYSAYSY